MRKTKYYIKNPTKLDLPLMHYVTIWLLLDRLHVPEFAWGIYWFLAAVIITLWIYYKVDIETKQVDIQDLLKKEHEKNETFKKFKEKFEEDLRKQTK